MHMNRFFTFIFGCAFTLAASAQTADLQFTDKNGNVVPDGTTLTIDAEAIDDGFDIIYEANSGLFVRNNRSILTGASIKWTVEQIDNGAVQLCFPINCVSKDATGTFDTEKGALEANETRSLQSEWYADAYGQCKVVYELMAYDYNGITGYSNPRVASTVTIIYRYADPAGINPVSVQRPQTYYDLSGRRVEQPVKGLYIQGGKKVIIK